MNNWSTVGAIFLLLGFVLLIFGVIQGVNAMNTISQLYGQLFGDYANQLKETLFWNAAQVYIAGSLVCFVVGGVGVAAGMSQKSGGETIPLSHPTSMAPNVSQIKCGSCGTMNDIDAVFCKKCGNQFGNVAKTEKTTSMGESERDKLIKCSNCGSYYNRQREKCPFCGKS